jgi:hypothetical protein
VHGKGSGGATQPASSGVTGQAWISRPAGCGPALVCFLVLGLPWGLLRGWFPEVCGSLRALYTLCYFTILCFTLPYFTILYTLLNLTVACPTLCYTVHHCAILTMLYFTIHYTLLYCTLNLTLPCYAELY